jgi:hypothetical protein
MVVSWTENDCVMDRKWLCPGQKKAVSQTLSVEMCVLILFIWMLCVWIQIMKDRITWYVIVLRNIWGLHSIACALNEEDMSIRNQYYGETVCLNRTFTVWIYVYTCMYICIYVCMYVCMYVEYIYADTNITRILVKLYKKGSNASQMYMYICVHTRVCMYMCICVSVWDSGIEYNVLKRTMK